MKVIKRGKPPEDQPFSGECSHCNSVMEAPRADLKVEDYAHDPGEFAHATCPVCGRDFVLYPKKG